MPAVSLPWCRANLGRCLPSPYPGAKPIWGGCLPSPYPGAEPIWGGCLPSPYPGAEPIWGGCLPSPYSGAEPIWGGCLPYPSSLFRHGRALQAGCIEPHLFTGVVPIQTLQMKNWLNFHNNYVITVLESRSLLSNTLD